MSLPPISLNQVLSAAVGATVGGLVAFFGGWFRYLWIRRRQRHSLATVMLQELRALDVSLRDVYGETGRGRLPESAFPLLERHDDALDLFSPETVKDLVEVTGLLAVLREYQESLSGGALDRSNVWVRGFAYAAIQRIPELKSSLEDEGAESVRWDPVEAPEGLDQSPPPDLPPSPFNS